MKQDISHSYAYQLLAMYQSGQISPVEVTQAVLKRIQATQSTINAYCLVDEESALQQALRSEQRWQQWRKQKTLDVGALEGVPTSIKDLILTRDWPTLRGSHTQQAQQQNWNVDAPVVARLREAGAVLLGKTNTPEFGCKGETNSPRFGLTLNPWDQTKSPGGSSGGAAAAVAAGLGPMAVGTDGAGSVRIPAAFCGNVGLKPSFGRVPAYPASPFGSVAHVGPHTMSVLDSALMLNVMAQPDARDFLSLPYAARDYRLGLNDGIAGLRIAYSATLGYAQNVDAEVATAVAKAVSVLSDLGAHVEAVDPGFEDPGDISLGLWFFGAYIIWSGLTAEQQKVTDVDFSRQAELGANYSASQIHALTMRRNALGAHMRQFMQNYDALITPTVAITAFEARPAGSLRKDEKNFLSWTPFSYPFNLTMQPALSIPCGLSKQGLPIGMQIVGSMFDDAMVLRIARAYEQECPLPRPRVND